MKRRHHWLTESQLKRLVDRANYEKDLIGDRDHVLITTAINTGLRCQELSDMTWDDLDFNARRIHVYGKGGKHADVGMTRDLFRVLLAWGQKVPCDSEEGTPVFPAMQRQWGDDPADDDLVVTSRALGPRAIHKRIQRAGQVLLHINNLGPHDLRRSLAGTLQDRGVPLENIQAVLRHSSVATTERYLAANPSRGVDTLKAFEL